MNPSFLLVFPLVLALSTPCEACLCKLDHPQTYYCISDFVIRANITGPGNNTKIRRGLKINVTEVLKGPKNLQNYTDIYTPLKWEKCAYEAWDSQQSGLIFAGYLRNFQMRFTRCHMVYPWDRLTAEQQLGFMGKYRKGCKCEIRPCLLCRRGCPEPDTNECVWKQRNCNYRIWEGDKSLFYTCVPKKGYCKWARAPGQ